MGGYYIAEREASSSDFLGDTDGSDQGCVFGLHIREQSHNSDGLQNPALAADSFGVSPRVAAALINAFQQDIGRVTPDDTTLCWPLGPFKFYEVFRN